MEQRVAIVHHKDYPDLKLLERDKSSDNLDEINCQICKEWLAKRVELNGN
jgi:hypothetical protein